MTPKDISCKIDAQSPLVLPETTPRHYKKYQSRNLLFLKNLIDDGRLTAHFQPISSIEKQKIFAYEALCRTIDDNLFNSIEEMFDLAFKSGLTLPLDMYCRENALALAAAQKIQQTDALLFINICPTSLTHPEHSIGGTEFLCKQFNIDKQKVVLEITEQEAVTNFSLFCQAVEHYRKCGFKVAIDDFGAGYGGLKMLSMLEPDFVKIDRHFFKDTTRSKINFNLIDAIFTACHRIGIDVIAEGIETAKELEVCREIGIDLIQGFYIARPKADLPKNSSIEITLDTTTHLVDRHFSEIVCVGDVVNYVAPLSINDRAKDVLDKFQNDPKLRCIPVIDKGRILGLINRYRFMENKMVGRLGYGHNLNYYKSVSKVLEESFIQVPHYISAEEVAKKIHLRKSISTYDDICVTKSGKYIGTVSVSNVLNAVTENSIKHAKGANPLSGLPGNEHIQRQISKMLSHSVHFDVCYIDIDNFKPYNDRHGFFMGDTVIKTVAEIANDVVQRTNIKSSIAFAGHIGGDDFIVITRPKCSILACNTIIEEFEKKLPEFHTPQECKDGYYASSDRYNQWKRFGLLSLSIGVVSTEVHPVESSAEISSLATDLKKRAKQIQGSVVIKDRRLQNNR